MTNHFAITPNKNSPSTFQGKVKANSCAAQPRFHPSTASLRKNGLHYRSIVQELQTLSTEAGGGTSEKCENSSLVVHEPDCTGSRTYARTAGASRLSLSEMSKNRRFQIESHHSQAKGSRKLLRLAAAKAKGKTPEHRSWKLDRRNRRNHGPSFGGFVERQVAGAANLHENILRRADELDEGCCEQRRGKALLPIMQGKTRQLQLVNGLEMPLRCSSVAELLSGSITNRILKHCSKHAASHGLSVDICRQI